MRTADSTIVKMLTGQFANKPAHGQSGHGLIISRTSQLADSSFGFKSYKDYKHICTLSKNW